MSQPHAFAKRDWFTCHTCGNMTFQGFYPYCEYNARIIRWDLRSYGCGNYCCSDVREEE